jgi:hypothetical protein
MTATTAPQDLAARARPRSGLDTRLLAILIPIGPLAIALVRGLLPYYTTASNTKLASAVAAHQGAEGVVIWLTFIAALTLIPGVIAVGLLARRHAPRMGTTGLVLAFAAFMSLFWSTVAGSDNVALAAARIGRPAASTGKLITSMGNIPALGLAGNLFVAGHILGLGLLGLALWRGRAVPAWAGITLAGSQLLHLVFAVIVPNHLLDGCAWGLTAVGFAMAAVALVKQSTETGPAAATR